LKTALKEVHRLRLVVSIKVGRMSDPKKEKVAGGWRRLHNEELHNMYASPNIVRVVKSRRLRCAGYVARMGEMRLHIIFWLEYLRGRDYLEDMGVGGKIILEWILGK
jgi:hypothetical protein